MPVIRIEMFEGRTIEQKRACAAPSLRPSATPAMPRPHRFISCFRMSPRAIGPGGRLCSDPKPE